MKERPILFSSPMVKALLAGTKTQTRRIMKPRPPSVDDVRAASGSDYSIFTDDRLPGVFRVAGPVWAVRERMDSAPEWVCPYGVAGDRLWVRENWALVHEQTATVSEEEARRDAMLQMPWASVAYQADAQGAYADSHRVGNRWRPSIHLPRWASRITLEVTEVRVERLQTLGDADARAEGFAHDDLSRVVTACSARDRFAILWDEINGKRASWESNPWVWVVSFRRQAP